MDSGYTYLVDLINWLTNKADNGYQVIYNGIQRNLIYLYNHIRCIKCTRGIVVGVEVVPLVSVSPTERQLYKDMHPETTRISYK